MDETLFHSLPAGLLLLGASGVIRRANPAALALLDAAEVEGRRLADFVHTEDEAEDETGSLTQWPVEPHRKALQLRRAPDEDERWLELQSFSGPNVGEVYVLLSNVTEWARARRQLVHAQTINKTGTWSFDLRRNQVWWSPELFRIFRLPPADRAPPYETHHELFSPESWARLQPAVKAAAEEGAPYELELELARTDEEGPLVAIARCEPQLDDEGKVHRLVGTFQDVTDIARAQRQNRASAERLAVAQSAADIAIWEWDVVNNEITWDERMHELYGIPPGPVRYEDWRALVHPDDIGPSERHIQTVLEGNSRVKNQFRILRPDGLRHILVAGTMVHDEATGSSRMIGVNIDVTERARHDEELRHANNLESLGLLAGGIAHDFNNLLTGILGLAESLELEPGDPTEVRETASAISSAVANTTRLTHQLLTFSKGGTPMRRTVSLESILQEQLTFSLRGSSSRFEIAAEPGLWPVNADPGQIAQVIQNLAINADQATGRGGMISVRARNLSPKANAPEGEGRFVELRIEDDGPGMTMEIQRRIFDPYFTTKEAGHGLGLSVCHSIIERHGGSIRVESKPGEGTRFVIRIPAAEAPAERAAAERPIEKGRGKVLIVDDLEGVRSSMVRLLGALGFEASEAASVEAALASVRTALDADAPFDVILTDLTMPGGEGGLEVVRRAKALDPRLLVIVTSGYAQDPVLAEFERHGFDAKLPKPIRASELADTLGSLLQTVPS